MFGITRPTLVANGVTFGNLGCCMASADFSVTKLVAKASALRLATRLAAGDEAAPSRALCDLFLESYCSSCFA